MFQFENGRFYADAKSQQSSQTAPRISFAIPEGFWMETKPLITSQYLLPLYSPDFGVAIDLWVEEENLDDTKEEMEEIVNRNADELLQEPQPITVNGMEGHSVMYTSNSEFLYEVDLDISRYGFHDSESGCELNRVRMMVHTRKRLDFVSVVTGDVVQSVLHGINVE